MTLRKFEQKTGQEIKEISVKIELNNYGID